MKMLLLSNSTMPGEPYFEWTKSYMSDFLKSGSGKNVFIPFAAASFSYDEYYQLVNQSFQSMGFDVESLHMSGDKIKSIGMATCIIVGGGNTFHLLNKLYEYRLLEAIQDRVKSGASYIGWSAGANVAGPTIKTTNDMPILEPESFNALNLIPFQINPHYTEAIIPNHGGESRIQRINEFLHVNPSATVVGLPEGTLLEITGPEVKLKGAGKAKIFRFNREILEVSVLDNLNWLLDL